MNSRLASVLLPVVLLAAACAPAASAPAPSAARESAPAAPAAPAASAPASNPAPAAPTASAALKPELPTSPVVDLKIGVLQLSNYAPFFIGQARGYFKELGLNVELIPTGNILEQLPSIAQGQLQVGACAASVPCYNALNRRIEVQIVGDLLSAGKTEKAAGSNALIVRKDLWDNGTIRTPQDLVGRTIHLIPGPGAGHHAATARWLQRNGVDPLSVEWGSLASFADQLAALENRGIELGVQTEPLLAAGIARGTHQVMATIEDMDPAY